MELDDSASPIQRVKGGPDEIRRQEAHLNFTASHQARHALRQQASAGEGGARDEDKPKEENAALFNETLAADMQDITSTLARLVAEKKEQQPLMPAGSRNVHGARDGAETGKRGEASKTTSGAGAGADADADGEAIREQLDALVDRVKGMRTRTAEASSFLKLYDLRRAQEEVGKLWASVESTRAELAPRKKFAFRSKSKSKNKANGIEGSRTSDSAQEGLLVAGTSKTEVEQRQGEQGEEGLGLRDLSGQDVDVASGDADKDKDFNLTNLDQCKITILHVLGALRLRRLSSCRVVCGPVRGPIYMEGCKNCVIVAAGRQLRIHDSQGVDFYMLVASGPIIEDCFGLRFAPTGMKYQEYPGFQRHLEEAALDGVANAWEDVKDFKWHRAQQSPNWSVITEAERESDSLAMKAPT